MQTGAFLSIGSTIDVIGVRLEQQGDEIDQYTDPEQAQGENIQDAHTRLAFVEFVSAEKAEEEA